MSFHPGVQSVQPELTLPTLRAQGRHPRISRNGILSGIKVTQEEILASLSPSCDRCPPCSCGPELEESRAKGVCEQGL